MALTPGTRLGPYEIVSALGAGGMSACGRRAERVRESKRGSWRGGGAPRHFYLRTPSPMPLTTGTRLGPYEIVAPIGAGGMGEVYRAKDTNLNRDVALKILPESFAADADRVARFTREAQVLASLNHPNIAAIYGVENNALVMELVEGQDLSAIIAQHGQPDAESVSRIECTPECQCEELWHLTRSPWMKSACWPRRDSAT